MDGRAWRATVHTVTKSQTGQSDFTFFLFFFLEAERDLFIKRKRMERNMLVSIG